MASWCGRPTCPRAASASSGAPWDPPRSICLMCSEVTASASASALAPDGHVAVPDFVGRTTCRSWCLVVPTGRRAASPEAHTLHLLPGAVCAGRSIGHVAVLPVGSVGTSGCTGLDMQCADRGTARLAHGLPWTMTLAALIACCRAGRTWGLCSGPAMQRWCGRRGWTRWCGALQNAGRLCPSMWLLACERSTVVSMLPVQCTLSRYCQHCAGARALPG